MTATGAERALDLLPAFYRERDARPDGAPGFLESLLTVIAEQFELVAADLDQVYDDLFIETCDAWVVPYIGDLVGVIPGAPVNTDAVLTRAAVADAIALRRRKGTIAVIEQLAGDVTGWPAVAVEMFERLAVTQHLEHVVPARGTTLSIRSALALERLDGSFDSAAHIPEVRRIGSARGRYNVPNVAVFVWRDVVLSHSWVDAHAVDSGRFRFNPLGVEQPLATLPTTEVTLAHRATPLNVAGPLSRRAVAAVPTDHYGLGRSVVVRRAGEQSPVDVADIVVCDLADSSPGGASWSNVSRLLPAQVAIDPELGRLAFGSAQPDPPQVSFVTTAPSDVGGSESRPRPATPANETVTRVRRDGTGGAAPTLPAALAACGGVGTVRIADSRTYSDPIAVTVPAQARLRVVSPEGALPVLDLPGPWTVNLGEGAILTLAGLAVAGGPLVVRGRPERVEITDCTFVPGRRLDADAQVTPPVGASLVVEVDADWQTDVMLTNCITGPLSVPADGSTLSIADSIVDAVDDGLGRSVASGAPARVVPVLRSPAPLGALSFPAGATTLRVQLGTDAPLDVGLAAVPTNAASAAGLLDAALAGSGARALGVDDHIVLVGDGRPPAVTPAAGSPLAAGLGLTSPLARTRAVLGGPADVAALAAGGVATVSDGRGEDLAVALAAGPADAASVVAALQARLRAAAPALAGVLVGVLDGALVAVPGDAAPLTFAGAPGDTATASSLGLVSARPAIAADPSGMPGARLRLARCTVLGDVDVAEIDLVTDSIITGRVTAERRQTGCVDYSWISPGSTTPRQQECQPATAATPPPAFVSRHYATPGYGRLRRAGATALVRGASDGFEMGAMARVRQTQRGDNLRRGIDEFLRFGLEAGVLDGS